MIRYTPPRRPFYSPDKPGGGESEPSGVGSSVTDTACRNFAYLKESIVRDYDRMNLDSSFCFGCHPGVPCFNDCCSDVNIFLTPYDVIRLKNRLKTDSGEFLAKYTVMPLHETMKHPVVLLKMTEDEAKRCPWVDLEKGCTVYTDRPWACRMFPVGKALPRNPGEEPFYFLMHESVCRGWEQSSEWTVGGWKKDQQVARWDEEGEKYKAVTLHPFFDEHDLTPAQMEMFHMVCFDLDRFRRFVFESTLLRRIELDEKTVRKLRNSDALLLDFGYNWLRFSLFHEPVFNVTGRSSQA